MNQPILVIMAAGMGSRYGGLKQMDPVGPSGELIIDYSLFDAKRAGFQRVIFIIKEEIAQDFKAMIGNRMEKEFEVQYVYQQVDALPAGYQVPDGRTKPWGTGHAVLCCKDYIDAPFCVINADDYYGADAFKAAYHTLATLKDDELIQSFMVGYLLKNTLTDHGHVSRGVCVLDEDGCLQDIHERVHIIKSADGALYTEDGETYHKLPEDSIVSMNLWGFTPGFMAALLKGFPKFLDGAISKNPLKGEYFLPTVVGSLLLDNRAKVQVLKSNDRWYGVTYQEDKPIVKQALKQLADNGLYPTPIWGE